MYRCLELAKLGSGSVAPNPMVGAVMVYNGEIIGEGYHQKYGEAHAEPNCIKHAIQNGHGDLISLSTLYVSLEPCVHFGKTPPCADLIIRNKIPKVMVGCRDPFKEVDAHLSARAGTEGNDAVEQDKGIEKLETAGVHVEAGILERECKELNRRFLGFHTQHRPYIILKWAQTLNRKIAGKGSDRLYITNEFTNRIVHKWRSEEASILIGTNTALMDDPDLTTRLWTGNSPVRLVVDMDLKLPSHLKIFNGQVKTIVFNKLKHEETDSLLFYQVAEDALLVHQIINALYQLKILSVIVEGGAKLLQSFIDEDLWDEARVITNGELIVNDGLDAPQFFSASKMGEEKIFTDKVEFFKPNQRSSSS
jgi:diaminohydroxyphosphoribosylaminopyrimidine deaminase / 5-amino-6-(5-phosphoribosylamino)uracil reductase